MKINIGNLTLLKRNPLTISRGTITRTDNVLLRVSHEGITGLGEAAPLSYGNPPISSDRIQADLTRVSPDLRRVAPWEFQRIEQICLRAKISSPALCAVDEALHDWTGKRLGVPVHRLFGSDLSLIPQSSITIGVDSPAAAARYMHDVISRFQPKVVKIKVGSPEGIDADRDMCAAIFEALPHGISVRVDANGGWQSVSDARVMLNWLASCGVEFVEQPFPPERNDDLAALFIDRPLPIILDESCWTSHDISKLAGCADGICLKLMKAGGLREGLRAIHTARANNMLVMIGCTSESSLSVSAGLSLASFADYVDLDSHLNLKTDPFLGLTWQDGLVVPSELPGLGVTERIEPEDLQTN